LSPSEQETDALSGLEERIQKAVQLVTRLREEKQAALADAAEARAENDRLAEEVKNLQAERRQVRTRIERLLGQIDGLSAG
jgi:FtsZ-binding cell division protein ZapB